MKSEERIKQEAKEFALNNSVAVAVNSSIDSYTAGAISERNKTIEEIQELFAPMYQIEPTKENMIQILEFMKDAHSKIESRKVTDNKK